MPSPERYIPIQVRLPISHPALLEGLETWLRLGLISEREVRELCQQYLVSSVPAPSAIRPEGADSRAAADGLHGLQALPNALVPDAIAAVPPQAPVSPAPAAQQNWVSQGLQRLINEVSVIWLLCLGVFLVVISSGVLAATQWQNFSPVGQYGILLGYTIAFVWVGLWTGTQPQLQLTSGMLKITSLLIIPVNFWMMDGFRLLNTPVGVGMAIVSGILLSLATVRLLPQPQTSVWAIANVLGLSWLHWGWGNAPMPLLATYAGCIGTSLVLLKQQHSQQRSIETPERPNTEHPNPEHPNPEHPIAEDPAEPDRAAHPPAWLSQRSPADILLPFAVLLLLFRACVVVAVPLEQLGLAFGMSGWLLCWLARNNAAQRIWSVIGAGLLVLGWAAGISAEVPWQSLLVGGLGLWLLGDRLVRFRRAADLVGLAMVGLVSLGVAVQLVPSPLREAIVRACTDWAGAAGMPDVLWSVGLYPYLWGWAFLAVRLRRWQSPRLVQTAYGLVWALGAGLVLASLANPTLRSLSLGLAFGTLMVGLRQPTERPRGLVGERGLVAIAQGLGLATVFSSLDVLAPQLGLQSFHHWGVVALGLMVLEWALLLGLSRYPVWQESTWFAGLTTAGLGYCLLFASWSASEPVSGAVSKAPESSLAPWYWGSASLAIPLGLTALLYTPQFRWPKGALILGTVSMIAVQVLTFDAVTSRLVGLGLGTVLMMLLTQKSLSLWTAAFSVGFGLTFGYAVGWETFPHRFELWLAVSSGLLLLLVTLRHGLSRSGWPVGVPLSRALDGWAIAVMLWTSLPLAVYSVLTLVRLFPGFFALSWLYPASSLVLGLAFLYRLWQNPNQGWLLGVAWLAEVALICCLVYGLQPLGTIAIATLALGFLTVLAGEGWTRRTGQPYRWSWNLIPLGYGALGWLLSNSEWTATSGLFTLAFAAIALSVGRRQPSWMPITGLGLLGVSVGAFQLLLHPLLRAQGGQAGDGVLALGALAIALAIASRLLDRWVIPALNLPPKSFNLFAHLHWGLGSIFLAIALSLPLSSTGEYLWSAEALALGGYALIQGRSQQEKSPQSRAQEDSPQPALSHGLQPLWIYGAVSQIFAAIAQGLYAQIPAAQLLPWASAIASGVSLGVYSLPWVRWGWVRSPFYHMAIIAPLVITLLAAFSPGPNTSSLLITGGFYGWMAFASQTVRLSYVGLIAANWAAIRLLAELNLTARIWQVSLVGLSVLFIAQIDPAFRASSRKTLRHWLRCFAVGLISTTVLYESDPYFGAGLFAIGLSLGLILLGLFLRVRAFLYVGTLTFLAKILRLVWLFIADESLVLWALGIALGLLLIWVAATFEARRAQVTALLQYWVTELGQWQ
ncbi:MAG: hypothetical protein MH252_21175 [Thermosynechococcaceae cyanobacterium MS004]|nr:hypothetical protein [Thermosynechococcaceae cyanobacterium MS004]